MAWEQSSCKCPIIPKYSSISIKCTLLKCVCSTEYYSVQLSVLWKARMLSVIVTNRNINKLTLISAMIQPTNSVQIVPSVQQFSYFLVQDPIQEHILLLIFIFLVLSHNIEYFLNLFLFSWPWSLINTCLPFYMLSLK